MTVYETRCWQEHGDVLVLDGHRASGGAYLSCTSYAADGARVHDVCVVLTTETLTELRDACTRILEEQKHA